MVSSARLFCGCAGAVRRFGHRACTMSLQLNRPYEQNVTGV